MKASHTISPLFDDPNLIGVAGLVPVLRLAESAGLYDLLAEHLSVDSPNRVAKAAGVVAGMLARADSIDGMDVLRHGGLGRVFSGVRAPSTLGTYLRAFTHGHVQQLDAAGSRLLAGLSRRVPGLLAGGTDPGQVAFIDVDDTIREVHGYAKQGAAFGYSGVRGLDAQLATISTPKAAPVIGAARLRSGNTASAQGAGRLLAQAVTTARRAGVSARLCARADSAFYQYPFVAAALRAGAWFSITTRNVAPVITTISSIPDHAWTPVRYPHAVWETDDTHPGGGYWISDAEVAEASFTAFTSRRKAEHVDCRLVVRRVRRLNPARQDELFPGYRHHAFITNSTLTTVDADAHHRDHAIVEQVIAELKNGPLAHLPSGSYPANAAWLAHAVIAFNLARAAGVSAGHGLAKARLATLQTRLIAVPGRVAATARRFRLHLPRDWPWTHAWQQLWATATSPPAALPT